MKAAVIFVLLFATVLCRPARKVSLSSSESSEEVVRRPAAPAKKQAVAIPQARAAPVQNIVAPAPASSDESTDSSDEDQAVAGATVEVASDSSATASTPDTASVSSDDSEDSDDDDDDDDESETEEDEDDSNDTSESGESSTTVPSTLTPVIVTEEPVPETTEAPIAPTIVTDEETARGDSLGGYPSDYKTIMYVEEKSYHEAPGPYKSYEFVNTGKKSAYDMTEGNDVEKSLQVYKTIHVHSDLLEEDTSTPEVESQGLETSSGTSQDQDLTPRQASLPEEEESTSTSDATTSESESSSTGEEEEEESASTASDSASTSTSQESEDEESESSEEATATPGAADSDSDESEESESDSDEDGVAPDITTDMPVVITAK